MVCRVGEYMSFYGAMCLHFAVENLTRHTRARAPAPSSLCTAPTRPATGASPRPSLLLPFFAAAPCSPPPQVSLDFRLVAGNCYDSGAASGLADVRASNRRSSGAPCASAAALGSYYSACERKGATGSFAVVVRGYPNHRHGFPHTRR